MVKFPNLVGAMAAKGKKHYEIALAVRMDESAFSRCVRGLRDFSCEQRQKIAAFLNCPEHWLFKELGSLSLDRRKARLRRAEVSRKRFTSRKRATVGPTAPESQSNGRHK